VINIANTRQHLLHEKKLEELVKDMPFYVAEYVDDKLDTRSPSTLLNYVLDFKLFLEWLFSENIVQCENIKDIPLSALENLRLDQARSFIKFLGRRKITVRKGEYKKAEKVSINRQISALRSLFKYLTSQTENDDGEPYFYRNVMLKIEVNKVKESLSYRASKISGKIFQNDEDMNFLSFIENEYEHKLSIANKPRQLTYFKRDKERDLALLSLFIGSGIRVSEISNLKLKDINLEENNISVIRKGGKKDLVAVYPTSMDDLEKYLNIRKNRYNATNDQESYVFVKKQNNSAVPLSNRGIETMVKKYTKAFMNTKSMSPHKLRHTYGTKLMAETNDIHLVMTQLGHSSTTTAALYTNPEQEKARQAAAELGKRRGQS
jgi:site-specific recombinase XerD